MNKITMALLMVLAMLPNALAVGILSPGQDNFDVVTNIIYVPENQSRIFNMIIQNTKPEPTNNMAEIIGNQKFTDGTIMKNFTINGQNQAYNYELQLNITYHHSGEEFTIKATEFTANDGGMIGSNTAVTKKFYIQKYTPCQTNWTCTAWTTCNAGTQTRNCTDLNGCGTNDEKPITQQSCTCIPNWDCNSWTSCINYTQNRTCNDLNNCGNLTNKPITNRTCCDEDWNCTSWSSCINYQQTRTCTDLNTCNTTSDKPTTTRSCGTPSGGSGSTTTTTPNISNSGGSLPTPVPTPPIINNPVTTAPNPAPNPTIESTQTENQNVTSTAINKSAVMWIGAIIIAIILAIIIGGVIMHNRNNKPIKLEENSVVINCDPKS
jgi:hypothetical protein